MKQQLAGLAKLARRGVRNGNIKQQRLAALLNLNTLEGDIAVQLVREVQGGKRAAQHRQPL